AGDAGSLRCRPCYVVAAAGRDAPQAVAARVPITPAMEATMKISKELAAEVAKKLRDDMDYDTARDAVDQATYGELDPWQLDKLTDWATDAARLAPERTMGDDA